MTKINQVPTRLTRWRHSDGGCYELWSTPQAGAPYRIYFSIGGMVVTEHPFGTELSARKDFERRVTEYVEAEGRR